MTTPKILFMGATLALAGGAVAWQQRAANMLPPPFATPSAQNPPRVVARPDGSSLSVPQGFQVEEFATGFRVPRYMILGTSGEILLTDSDSRNGAVYVLQGTAKETSRKTLIEGLTRPYGLALHDQYLYVGDEKAVRRYPYDAKAMTVGKAEDLIDLSGVMGGHWTRSLAFDPQGQKLYVGVGSRSNVDAGEPELRATISRYNPDGSGREIFAIGTRNPIGLHFQPGTSTLWAAVQERDALGDDLVPDYFTHVQQGGFYGWPYAYSGPNEDPRRKNEKPDLVKKAIVPDVLLGAHLAVLDFEFYTGKQFPAQYQNGVFFAFHGSWNRSQRVGYQVGFLPFKDGKPAAEKATPFLTGWLMSPDKREVWGRPVGLLVMPDGSLLVSDDGGKKLWRIHYGK